MKLTWQARYLPAESTVKPATLSRPCLKTEPRYEQLKGPCERKTSELEGGDVVKITMLGNKDLSRGLSVAIRLKQ